MINLLGYRNFMSTDMTAANVYQFLGTQEPGIGTLCIDESNGIDEDSKLMEIHKTGYITNNRVPRTDTSNGRIQNAYHTFSYKAFAGEGLSEGPRANGFNERIIPLHCYPGNPKYDISEVISPAGEEEYQQQLDAIEHTHNLSLIYRLLHHFEPIQKVQTGLKNREKQLFGSLIRMYHGDESIWPEIKSVISHFISERRERQWDTFHAYLYGLVKRQIKENGSLEIKSADIWDKLKAELPGSLIPNRPLSYDTERYGKISQSQVTKTLMEILELRNRFIMETQIGFSLIKKNSSALG